MSSDGPRLGEQVRYDLNGYRFYGTVHGPMVWDACVRCGKDVLVVGVTDRVNEWGLKEDTGGDVAARCSGCARRHHGV